MSGTERERRVEQHYGRGGLLGRILDALRAAGKDLESLTPADLAPVDEFHLRGREATLELVQDARPRAGERVLDLGCGLGGSARHLAHEHGCRVSGVDLTAEYVAVARALAELVGLGDAVAFHHGSALDTPFADASFDLAWTEHAQMNVADKRGFYAEVARVLVPGGRLALHDIFQGPAGAPRFPVPWAEDAGLSALVPPEEARALLGELGLGVRVWEDVTARSLAWLAAAAERAAASGPSPLGIHLLLGPNAPVKLENLARNLREGRIVALRAVAVRE